MRWVFLGTAMIAVLWACTEGTSTPSAPQAPTTATSDTQPPTSDTGPSVETTSPPPPETPTTSAEIDCGSWSDQAVAIWQEFFDALGPMGAEELGSERWMEIDADNILAIESFDYEATAAGCGNSRELICLRLGELETGGEVAAFYFEVVEAECNL